MLTLIAGAEVVRERAAVEEEADGLAGAGDTGAAKEDNAPRSAFFARNLSLASRSSASMAARASASRCSVSERIGTLPWAGEPAVAFGDKGGATAALTLLRRVAAIGLTASSSDETKEVMLDMMELVAEAGGLSSGTAAGCGFDGGSAAEPDEEALGAKLAVDVCALLCRLGDAMGFIALSREDTRELMLDKNPPSESLPLSLFFKIASAFACCFSAAAASLATCNHVTKNPAELTACERKVLLEVNRNSPVRTRWPRQKQSSFPTKKRGQLCRMP